MEALAATVVGSFLYPTLKAGIETVGNKVAEALGDSASEHVKGLAKGLWKRVREAFGSEEKERTTLELFESDPDTYESAVQSLLAKKLTSDPTLAKELEEMVNSKAPGTSMTGAQIMNAENVGLVDLRQADLRQAHHMEIVGQKIGPAGQTERGPSGPVDQP